MQMYKIKWFNITGSTFSDVENARAALSHKEIWAARYQSAGKGQKGNSWSSAAGQNLTFTLLLRHNNFDARRQFLLSQAVSLGVCEFLRKEGAATRIKWPNDIYAGQRKICGILIRHTVSGGMLSDSVVGIGLNINQTEFPATVPNPVSLAQITGRQYDVEALLPSLADCIYSEYDSIGPETDIRYHNLLYLKGEEHIFTDCATREKFSGTIEGAGPDGRLRIATAGGERLFAFKEVAY